MRSPILLTALGSFAALLPCERLTAADELPLAYQTNFEAGDALDAWAPFDPAAWALAPGRDGQVLAQQAASQYEPPHRSPFNVALLREPAVGSFQLDVRVRSTCRDYGHRDVCLVFGYQDPARFYYVHLGKETDDHANQIFVVDDAPRTKISTKTSAGTPWDDAWHRVRIVRDAESGAIEVFFDDLAEPVMTANDARFTTGQIGLGTFDDTAEFDEVELRGELPDEAAAPSDVSR